MSNSAAIDQGVRGATVGTRESVTGRQADWADACVRAATDDEFYRAFRRDETFLRVIEGTPRLGGLWNLRRLVLNDAFLRALPLIQKSDFFGAPRELVEFEVSVPGVDALHRFTLNPTTIRYANNAANCVALFGEDIFQGKTKIVEIGAGYGGECKIFNDFSSVLGHNTLRDCWYIYDLLSSQELITKFLGEFGYAANFVQLGACESPTSEKSLVISNGAFSEMRGELLDDYFYGVISNAQMGYFITNFESHSAPFGGWTTTAFISKLEQIGRNVMELDADQYLSHFDKKTGSRLVVFGANTQSPRTRHGIVDVAWARGLAKYLQFGYRLQARFLNR